jgi:hypothetical protein
MQRATLSNFKEYRLAQSSHQKALNGSVERCAVTENIEF